MNALEDTKKAMQGLHPRLAAAKVYGMKGKGDSGMGGWAGMGTFESCATLLDAVRLLARGVFRTRIRVSAALSFPQRGLQ